ncbi:MAG: TetR/AcrR family transcriptional regulator [Vagococcus sp.]|uniref:TetR/AcrR family transcriptional regulator n=1 Tax=Vagococcus sp. TaxID=1933889 RepID=UPI002FCC5634
MKQRYDGEQTKEDILMAAGALFNEKGYKQTSIQNIVDQLDGLTKGAVYHHFRSKEAILDELMRAFMPSNEILSSIRSDDSLTGLEKIQQLFLDAMFHVDVQKFLPLSPLLVKEPLLSLKHLKLSQTIFIPEISLFIKEGNKDGSINVPHPEQSAEVILFLLTSWYNTTFFTNSLDSFYSKLETSQYVLKKMGVNILDDSVISHIRQQINQGIEAINNEKSMEN